MELQNVALVGYMRSGKDSVAACLQHLDPKMGKISFAGALKREVAEALNSAPTSRDPIGGYTESYFNIDAHRPQFRPLLQWWGTEFRRAQDPNYWVKRTQAHMLAEPQKSWVCTDGRFYNELTMLREQGFKIVELAMDVTEVADYLRGQGLDREQVTSQLAHPSEREWQGFGKDASFTSQFGNLPRLTLQIVRWLSPQDWSTEMDAEIQERIAAFYADLYPKTYGVK